MRNSLFDPITRVTICMAFPINRDMSGGTGRTPTSEDRYHTYRGEDGGEGTI